MFPENGWTFNNTQIIQLNKALLRRSWTQAFNDMKNLSKNLKNVIFAAFDPVAKVWVVKLKDASLPQFFLIKVVDIEWKKKSYFTFKIQVCLHGVAWQGKSLKKNCIYIHLILLWLWQPCYFGTNWSKYLKRDILKLTVSIIFKSGHSN